MKKLILFLTVLAFALTANVSAQTVNEEVDVTANVQTQLSLVGNNVAFGDVNSGSVSYVNAGTGDTRTSENSSASTAGSLDITANNNAGLLVSWGNATLTDIAGDNPTSFTPTVVFGGSVITSQAGITLTGTTGSLGIGGELTITGGVTGNFSTANPNGSPIVFTVEYGTL